MKYLFSPARACGAVVIAAGLLPGFGCSERTDTPKGGSHGAAAPAAAVPVTLVPVETRSVERVVEISGTLLGQEEVTISSKVSGRIVAILRDLGDTARPGETLARIDPRDFELALAERRATAAAALAKLGLKEMPEEPFDATAVPTVQRARAEVSNAEARLERASRLFEQSPPLISAQDYADIQTARDVARSQAEVELMTAHATLAEAGAQAAAVAVAEQQLADATVTAPGVLMDGGLAEGSDASSPADQVRRYRVAQRLTNEGEYVTEGRELFRLVSSDVVKLRAFAPERFAGAISAGQRALVTTEASGGPVEGRVSRVSPAVDPASRAFAVEIEVENGDGALKPGSFAQGRVVTRIEEGVALVPLSAVVSFAGVNRVFSVKDGKAIEHRVRLGQRIGEHVEVVGGLDAAHVINGNAAGLVQGASVEVAGGM